MDRNVVEQRLRSPEKRRKLASERKRFSKSFSSWSSSSNRQFYFKESLKVISLPPIS